MTKDVIVTLNGLQAGPEDDDTIEVTTSGSYYFKNGKHFILFDEIGDKPDTVVKNTIIIGDSHVDVRKKGAIETQMAFEEGCKLNSFYASMFGQMELGIYTDRIDMKEESDQLELTLHYRLEINNEHVSDNQIYMRVEAMGHD